MKNTTITIQESPVTFGKCSTPVKKHKPCGCGVKKGDREMNGRKRMLKKQASNMNISGKILGANKEPLPSAHIVNLDTEEGTVANDTGNYSINVSNPDDLIEISFVGLETLTLPASQITEVIELKEGNVLDEIIISSKKSMKKNTAWWVLGGVAALFVVNKTRKKKSKNK